MAGGCVCVHAGVVAEQAIHQRQREAACAACPSDQVRPSRSECSPRLRVGGYKIRTKVTSSSSSTMLRAYNLQTSSAPARLPPYPPMPSRIHSAPNAQQQGGTGTDDLLPPPAMHQYASPASSGVDSHLHTTRCVARCRVSRRVSRSSRAHMAHAPARAALRQHTTAPGPPTHQWAPTCSGSPAGQPGRRPLGTPRLPHPPAPSIPNVHNRNGPYRTRPFTITRTVPGPPKARSDPYLAQSALSPITQTHIYTHPTHSLAVHTNPHTFPRTALPDPHLLFLPTSSHALSHAPTPRLRLLLLGFRLHCRRLLLLRLLLLLAPRAAGLVLGRPVLALAVARAVASLRTHHTHT